jgi:hypothetical protein
LRKVINDIKAKKESRRLLIRRDDPHTPEEWKFKIKREFNINHWKNCRHNLRKSIYKLKKKGYDAEKENNWLAKVRKEKLAELKRKLKKAIKVI